MVMSKHWLLLVSIIIGKVLDSENKGMENQVIKTRERDHSSPNLNGNSFSQISVKLLKPLQLLRTYGSLLYYSVKMKQGSVFTERKLILTLVLQARNQHINPTHFIFSVIILNQGR